MTDQTESHKDLEQPEILGDNDCLRVLDQYCDLFRELVTAVMVSLKEYVDTKQPGISIDDNDKHLQDHNQPKAQEKNTHEEPCKVEEEEKSAVEEEQRNSPTDDQIKQRQEEEPKEGNVSSDVKKSLNNTQEIIKAVKKLVMDLNSLYESLANFSEKALPSYCKHSNKEASKTPILQQRKGLSDLSFQLASSPRTVASSKDDYDSTASTAKGTSQRTNREDSDPSDTETAPPKDTSTDSIPSDTVAAQEDMDSKDDADSETQLASTEHSNNDVTPSMGASATSQKGDSKNVTFLDPKESSQQDDGNSSSSNKTMSPPKHTSAASEMEVAPNNPNSPVDQVVLDDDEFDLVSPEGMRRMFGTQSQESKIQFPPPSPPSNEIMTPPKDTPAASETEASPEDPKYPADQVVLDDVVDLVSPARTRRMFDTLPQESKIQFPPPSPSPYENMMPPSDTSASPETDVTPDNQKYSADQTVPHDDEFDFVSPEGMRRMFGSQSQESKIQFLPPSPPSNKDMTPPKDTSAVLMEVTPDDQKYSADQTVLDDDEFDLVSPEGMTRMFGTHSQESKIQFPPPSPIYIGEDSPTRMKINFEVNPVGGENES